MSNGFLSQEEINALLNQGNDDSNVNNEGTEENKSEEASNNIDQGMLTDIEKDMLGEIGNISMGSASTALYQIINQKVNITTPVVTITTLNEIKNVFDTPTVVLDVEYTKGIIGRNILIIQIQDAAVIANLMMGGDGKVETHELTELEISAVQEAMNQMIGSSATSMATMLNRTVDISPPVSKIWSDKSELLSDNISEDEPIVRVNFRMTIGDLVDSSIMQVLPIPTAKKIGDIMMGTDTEDEAQEAQVAPQPQVVPEPQVAPQPQVTPQPQPQVTYQQPVYEQPIQPKPPVEVHPAAFEPLTYPSSTPPPENIDLILDVPLDISVVLGRTKKSIKDILALGTGSLIELEKLAEEPVEILVNGKKIAFGEVVVVDENFGVRKKTIKKTIKKI